jgi:CHASE3 domain sensor protein
MQWTIKRKLLLGFGFAALLIIGCVAIARWAQVRAQATQEAIIKTYAMINDLEHLGTYMGKARTIQRGYLISGDARVLTGLTGLRGDANDTMARVTAAVKDTPEQADRFMRWKNDLQQRRAFTNQMNAVRKDQGFEAARVLFANGGTIPVGNRKGGQRATPAHHRMDRSIDRSDGLDFANRHCGRLVADDYPECADLRQFSRGHGAKGFDVTRWRTIG